MLTTSSVADYYHIWQPDIHGYVGNHHHGYELSMHSHVPNLSPSPTSYHLSHHGDSYYVSHYGGPYYVSHYGSSHDGVSHLYAVFHGHCSPDN